MSAQTAAAASRVFWDITPSYNVHPSKETVIVKECQAANIAASPSDFAGVPPQSPEQVSSSIIQSSPASQALSHDNDEFVEEGAALLEEAEAAMDVEDELFIDLCAEMFEAISSGQLDDVIQLVEEADIPANMRDDVGNTALHYAAFEGQASICEYLMDKGADIEATNMEHSWTPLVAAAFAGDISTVTILLERNPNVNHVDLHGLTALDYALQENYTDCAEALRAAGAISGPAAVVAPSQPAIVEVAEQLEPIEDCDFAITPAVDAAVVAAELPAVTDFSITYHFGSTSQFIDPEAGCVPTNATIYKAVESPIRSYVGQMSRTPAPKLAIGPLAEELTNAAVVETAVNQLEFIAPETVPTSAAVSETVQPTEPVVETVAPVQVEAQAAVVVASKASSANYFWLFAAVLLLIFFLISAWLSTGSSEL